MRYDFIAPIVKAAEKVLDFVTQEDIVKGEFALKRSDEIDYGVAIYFKVSGEVDGNMILNMDSDTALKICSLMLGEHLEEVTTLGLDTVAELGNMIVGNVISELNDSGVDMEISPPLVATRAYILRKTGEVEVFQVPLFTSAGEITLNAALSTN